MEPYLRSGALDVVLVGDLDVAESIQAVSQTFGVLGPLRVNVLNKVRLRSRTFARLASEIVLTSLKHVA